MLKKTIITIILLLSFSRPAWAGSGISLAGIELGDNANSYLARVDMASSVKIFDQEYLSVAKILPTEGYKSGYVTYGTCANSGEILKIKLKYADESASFFNKVKNAVESKYGKHDEWRGNAFGTLKTWKWSIKDTRGRDVSIILMRYVGDDDAFTQGNSIRISLPDEFGVQKKCWEEKNPDPGVVKVYPPTLKGLKWYIPQQGK